MPDDLSTGKLWNPRAGKHTVFRGAFAGSGTVVSQPWTKPENASFIYIIAIGAGGGGGAGASGGANAGGGSGGACGNVSVLLISARLCPAQLYVGVSLGGLGSSGGNGTSGSRTTFSTSPTSQSANVCLLVSATTTSSVGVDGAAGAGGGATGSPSAATVANNVFAALGNFGSCPGQNTGAGGTGAAGSNILQFAGQGTTLSSGAGGGGSTAGGADQNGGDLINPSPAFTALIPTITGGRAGSVNGNPGLQSWSLSTGGLWIFTGGAGGASNVAGQGGRGGDGAIGCGGGGGGGGLTRGPGGNGGPGLGMIMWW